MMENTKLAFNMLQHAIAEGKLLELFHQQVFLNRIATPAWIDLTKIGSYENTGLDKEFQFVELKADDLHSGKWDFAVPNRRIKAHRNLKRSLRGFAIVQDSIVLGDFWCTVGRRVDNKITHPDLQMLGIVCEQDEAYGLDMFITPEYRGKNLAVSLQRYLQTTLKLADYKKIYGYYWDDNIPAMWMHRMLQFKELPKRRVSRFFSFIKAGELSSKKSQ